MIDELPEEKQLRYSLYMDNLFSGSALFSFLRFRGMKAIGTIRENRIPRGCPLTAKSIFQRKERGYFEKAIEKNDGLIYVRWMDNAVVTMLSSFCGTKEVTQVKRFSQKDKRSIQIPRPQLILKYNNFMGGTDQMDQNIACYRIGIRGKKWYWPIFTWLLDAALQNSWVLYNRARKCKISQLKFKREIANIYLKKYGIPSKGGGRPPASPSATLGSRVSADLRFDKTEHLVKHTEGKKRRRCNNTSCTSVVRTMCSKCEVGLCIDCFIPFHTR